MLKVEYKKDICQITIQRPKARNAINFEVMEQWEQLLDILESRREVRCLILTGSGAKAFISGGDLKAFHTIKKAGRARSMARRMHTILERLEKLSCWTIAAINGPAYGGGCEIMLAFDFRIASSKAVFGFTQGNFYLPPGWGGLTRLTERVGRSTALQWLAESAIVDAQTALKHRLIDRLVPPDKLRQQSLTWAKKLCQNDRQYIRALKQGALKLNPARWQAIEEELEPFGHFWADERHQQQVQKFFESMSGS